ncbi:nascent polypeptide-associated complex subunit alpha, muscle-specific form-like [Meles meles]|uniref:nascent polypeptide-associated complex subunit alpha, muscle-specific form-like n=1 Tax=Meles meles TaxID=9662 RepID=UPI001E69FCF0|nr:nascent polypeptide-associated complex subunit alpha, muscle-specific form-like [Meles meles]
MDIRVVSTFWLLGRAVGFSPAAFCISPLANLRCPGAGLPGRAQIRFAHSTCRAPRCASLLPSRLEPATQHLRKQQGVAGHGRPRCAAGESKSLRWPSVPASVGGPSAGTEAAAASGVVSEGRRGGAGAGERPGEARKSHPTCEAKRLGLADATGQGSGWTGRLACALKTPCASSPATGAQPADPLRPPQHRSAPASGALRAPGCHGAWPPGPWRRAKGWPAALAGNRTRVNCLEGSYAHHYTTNAAQPGPPPDAGPGFAPASARGSGHRLGGPARRGPAPTTRRSTAPRSCSRQQRPPGVPPAPAPRGWAAPRARPPPALGGRSGDHPRPHHAPSAGRETPSPEIRLPPGTRSPRPFSTGCWVGPHPAPTEDPTQPRPTRPPRPAPSRPVPSIRPPPPPRPDRAASNNRGARGGPGTTEGPGWAVASPPARRPDAEEGKRVAVVDGEQAGRPSWPWRPLAARRREEDKGPGGASVCAERGRRRRRPERASRLASPSGNRTPVSRVTGGDTHHYTNEDGGGRPAARPLSACLPTPTPALDALLSTGARRGPHRTRPQTNVVRRPSSPPARLGTDPGPGRRPNTPSAPRPLPCRARIARGEAAPQDKRGCDQEDGRPGRPHRRQPAAAFAPGPSQASGDAPSPAVRMAERSKALRSGRSLPWRRGARDPAGLGHALRQALSLPGGPLRPYTPAQGAQDGARTPGPSGPQAWRAHALVHPLARLSHLIPQPQAWATPSSPACRGLRSCPSHRPLQTSGVRQCRKPSALASPAHGCPLNSASLSEPCASATRSTVGDEHPALPARPPFHSRHTPLRWPALPWTPYPGHTRLPPAGDPGRPAICSRAHHTALPSIASSPRRPRAPASPPPAGVGPPGRAAGQSSDPQRSSATLAALRGLHLLHTTRVRRARAPADTHPTTPTHPPTLTPPHGTPRVRTLNRSSVPQPRGIAPTRHGRESHPPKGLWVRRRVAAQGNGGAQLHLPQMIARAGPQHPGPFRHCRHGPPTTTHPPAPQRAHAGASPHLHAFRHTCSLPASLHPRPQGSPLLPPALYILSLPQRGPLRRAPNPKTTAGTKLPLQHRQPSLLGNSSSRGSGGGATKPTSVAAPGPLPAPGPAPLRPPPTPPPPPTGPSPPPPHRHGLRGQQHSILHHHRRRHRRRHQLDPVQLQRIAAGIRANGAQSSIVRSATPRPTLSTTHPQYQRRQDLVHHRHAGSRTAAHSTASFTVPPPSATRPGPPCDPCSSIGFVTNSTEVLLLLPLHRHHPGTDSTAHGSDAGPVPATAEVAAAARTIDTTTTAARRPSPMDGKGPPPPSSPGRSHPATRGPARPAPPPLPAPPAPTSPHLSPASTAPPSHVLIRGK